MGTAGIIIITIFRLIVWGVTWLMMGFGLIVLIVTSTDDTASIPQVAASAAMVAGGGVVILGGAYSVERVIEIVERMFRRE